MGWGNCGWNERWKVWMGYCNEGVCMHEGCSANIDHGLAYVCGGMHEGGEEGCGKYCCEKHLFISEINGKCVQLCEVCYDEANDECDEDEE